MLWVFLSIAVIASSPVGRAIADRMSGKSPDHDDDDGVRFMEQRIEDRILELEDRLDMAERLLRRPRSSSDRTEAGP